MENWTWRDQNATGVVEKYQRGRRGPLRPWKREESKIVFSQTILQTIFDFAIHFTKETVRNTIVNYRQRKFFENEGLLQFFGANSMNTDKVRSVTPLESILIVSTFYHRIQPF